ncbi:MAG TPA: hypothetical protein VG982_01410 [Candidatus Paceibacterota bacterium]|nr:hypothetical protein [Candidatus Paceibacterota bacterium]
MNKLSDSSFSALVLNFFFFFCGIFGLIALVEINEHEFLSINYAWYFYLAWLSSPLIYHAKVRNFWRKFYEKSNDRMPLYMSLLATIVMCTLAIFSGLLYGALHVSAFRETFLYTKVGSGIITLSFLIVVIVKERKDFSGMTPIQ